MSTVAEMIRRIQGLNVTEQTRESIEETKEVLIEMNQAQMKEGVLADGSIIRWLKDSHYPYTPAYAKRKARKGLQTSVVDLKVDGTFWKSEEVKVDDTEIQFFSQIKLSEYLQSNYGVKIHGITTSNRTVYTQENFFPALKRRIEEQTGLRFE